MSQIFLRDAVYYKSTTKIVKTFTRRVYYFTHKWERASGILHPCVHTRCYGLHYLSLNMLTTSGLSILMHGVLSLPDTMSCDKRN